MLRLVVLIVAISAGMLEAAKPVTNCEILYDFYEKHHNLSVLECKSVKLRFFSKYSQEYNQWPLIIEIPYGPSIYLLLRKVDSVVTKRTFVYFGNNNGTTDCATTYEKFTIQKMFPDLKEIFTFQDYEKKAAITIFSYGEDNLILEGFVGNFVLRSTDDGQYFLLQVTYPFYEFKKIDYSLYKKNDRFDSHDLSFPIQDEVLVKILVALDWSSVKQGMTQTIQSLLVFYNAANMLFQPFTSPKIQLAVTGIVVPTTEYSTPYFPTHQFRGSNATYINLNSANENLRKYFAKEKAKVFPSGLFDVIIGMTDLPICDADYDCQHYGVSDQSVIYRSQSAGWNEPVPIVGAVRHPNFQGTYAVVAREVAHILGSSYNSPYYKFNNCNGLMNKFVRPDSWPLDWSVCNINDMSVYFSLNQFSGFSRNNRRVINNSRRLWR